MELRRLESRERRILRLATRSVVLAVGAVCALGVLPWPWTAMVLPALSPYVAIGAALAGRTLLAVTPFGLFVAAVAISWPRWFCRKACPVGLLIELVGRLRPKAKPRLARVPPFGQWVVLVTLAGALLGYPTLLWLDPLALFNGFFTGLRQPLNWTMLIVGIGLPLVLLLGLLWPFIWCRRVCPLGATQDLLAFLRRLIRRRRREALHLDSGPRVNPLARRTAIGMVAGGCVAVAVPRWARGSGNPPLRPPGAIGEERFTGLCIRCGNCVRACPTHIIQPDPGRHGLAGLLAPLVSFETGYCQPDCHRCTQVCPSGAIAQLTLAEKEQAVIGLARVDMPTCLLSRNEECGACVAVCPYQAIELGFDDEDYSSTVAVNPEACNGCGACELNCPTEPARAIRVCPTPRDRRA